jgi:hypothetical protein
MRNKNRIMGNKLQQTFAANVFGKFESENQHDGGP